MKSGKKRAAASFANNAPPSHQFKTNDKVLDSITSSEAGDITTTETDSECESTIDAEDFPALIKDLPILATNSPADTLSIDVLCQKLDTMNDTGSVFILSDNSGPGQGHKNCAVLSVHRSFKGAYQAAVKQVRIAMSLPPKSAMNDTDGGADTKSQKSSAAKQESEFGIKGSESFESADINADGRTARFCITRWKGKEDWQRFDIVKHPVLE